MLPRERANLKRRVLYGSHSRTPGKGGMPETGEAPWWPEFGDGVVSGAPEAVRQGDTVVLWGTWHHTFVKTHEMCGTKNHPDVSRGPGGTITGQTCSSVTHVPSQCKVVLTGKT